MTCLIPFLPLHPPFAPTDGAPKLGWNWYYFSNVILGTCRLCFPYMRALQLSPVLAHDHGMWEEGFCQCLQAGPFDDLQTATGCSIKFDQTNTKNSIEKPKVVTADMVMDAEPTSISFDIESESEPVSSDMKDAFVDACLTSSFNNINDPREYVLKSVEVDDETINQIGTRATLRSKFSSQHVKVRCATIS